MDRGTQSRRGKARFLRRMGARYAAEGYAAANDALIEWMERFAEGYPEAKIARLVEIFVDCSRFESLFWDMAWGMEM